MTTMKINRAPKDTENLYLKISVKLLMDERLSFSAKGLMCFILNNKDTFPLSITYLKKASKLSRKQFYDAWNSLQEYKYIILHNNGKRSWSIIVNENVQL